MSEQTLNRIKKIIEKLINLDNKISGKYLMPYSTSDEDYAEFIITYEYDRLNLWEADDYYDCKYDGSLYVKILNIKVGFEGDWETFKYVSDLPSWVEDDLKEKIFELFDSEFPFVCFDLTFTY
jgi:hypothetical protein